MPEWQDWAIRDRRVVAVSTAYTQLYRIYQDSRASAESFEVLMAFGYLTTESGGRPVRRHLLTSKVVVELDLDSGRLSVLPAPDAPIPHLEQDMLDPEDTVSDAVRQAILGSLETVDDPWAEDPDGVSGVLRLWVNGQSADAVYAPAPAPHVPRARMAGEGLYGGYSRPLVDTWDEECAPHAGSRRCPVRAGATTTTPAALPPRR